MKRKVDFVIVGLITAATIFSDIILQTNQLYELQ